MTIQSFKNPNFWGLDCEDKTKSFAIDFERIVSNYETENDCKMHCISFDIVCQLFAGPRFHHDKASLDHWRLR